MRKISRIMKKSCLPLLFVLLNVACTHRPFSPDRSIDDVRAIMQDVSERNRNFKLLTERDDTLMQGVVAYYKEYGESNELMEAYYLLGSVYRDLHEAPKAMEAFMNGISVADTLSGHCRYDLLMRLHAQKSELYYKQDLYYQSMEEDENEYKFACLAKDTLFMVNALWDRLGKYYVLCDYQSIVDKCWDVLEESQNLNMYTYAAGQLCTSVLACVELNRLTDARKLLDIYERYSGDVDLRTMESSFPIYYYTKGRLLAAEHKLDSAELFFRKELVAQDWNNRQSAYRGLRDVFEQMGRRDSALKYARLQCDAVDSAYQENVTTHIQNLHEIYDYSRAQRDSYEKSVQLEKKQRKLQRTWTLMGMAAVVILFVFYWLYSRYEKRISTTVLELEKANARLSSQEDLLVLLNERLRHVDDEAEKTLLTEQLKAAKTEAKRQELVVKEKQEELKQLRKWAQNRAKKIRMHYQSDEVFQELQNKLKMNKVATPEDYERVESRLLQDDIRLMRRFYTTVPEASETDRKTFLLFRFGLRKSETASLMAHERAASANTCDRMFEKAVGRKPSNRAEAYNWILEL